MRRKQTSLVAASPPAADRLRRAPLRTAPAMLRRTQPPGGERNHWRLSGHCFPLVRRRLALEKPTSARTVKTTSQSWRGSVLLSAPKEACASSMRTDLFARAACDRLTKLDSTRAASGDNAAMAPTMQAHCRNFMVRIVPCLVPGNSAISSLLFSLR